MEGWRRSPALTPGKAVPAGWGGCLGPLVWTDSQGGTGERGVLERPERPETKVTHSDILLGSCCMLCAYCTAQTAASVQLLSLK